MSDAPAEPQHDIKAVPQHEAWRDLLYYKKPGYIEPHSLANMVTILTYSKRWKGVFAFDLFSGEIIMQKCPPYMDDSDFVVHRLVHEDIVYTTCALEFDGLAPTTAKIVDAIKAAARKNQVHPARDYFNRIVWDGDKRLDHWLRDYLGAVEQDDDYLRAVGSKWLIAGVRRVFQPGCKFDTMLVLEGEQGIGKSRALRTLSTFGNEPAVEYFTDAVRFENITHPSSIMEMQGKMIVEFAELSGMNRKEIEDIKNWITIQIDSLQKKYENPITPLPRQFILAGTTNDDAYLRDPSGNRRFLPVKCSGQIDIEALHRDREQIWAEAVARHKQGEDIHIDPSSAVARTAQAEQEKRLIDDVWTDAVMKYVEHMKEATMNEILQAIPIEPGRRDEVVTRRVSKILRIAGWKRGYIYHGNSQRRAWVNPDRQRAAQTGDLKLEGDWKHLDEEQIKV